MKVRLEKIGAAAFTARGEESGAQTTLDGKPEIGGEGRGMRPTELLLAGLGGCAAMDVVHILKRQGEPLEALVIEVDGERNDKPPTRFVAFRLRFLARGNVDRHKLERAVALSVEKYCTVRNSLDPAISVTWEAVLEG